MYNVFVRNPQWAQYGWEELSYSPRPLWQAIKLLKIYRERFPERTYVLGRDDCFGRPTLDAESELAITARLCEPITHDDVFEMVG